VLRIDHVFTRGTVSVRRVEVIRNAITRVASDHLPLVVDLEVHLPIEPRT
jgi:endonuclease/exonuclease/phosphatase family metal-dependent hydrolase